MVYDRFNALLEHVRTLAQTSYAAFTYELTRTYYISRMYNLQTLL
jgi:hypothetical protein